MSRGSKQSLSSNFLCWSCKQPFSDKSIPTKCRHCNFNRCTSCSNKHTNCPDKVIYDYGDIERLQKRNSKPKAVLKDLVGNSDVLNSDAVDEEILAPTAASTSTATVGKKNQPQTNESSHNFVEDNLEDIAQEQKEKQKEPCTERSNIESVAADPQEDHCCSTADFSPPEGDKNESQDALIYSEDCDVLVSVMSDKFKKGYKVAHNPSKNITWIAGQVYKRKNTLLPYVLVQFLELHDSATEEGKDIDRINFLLAAYEGVADFVQIKNKKECSYDWDLEIVPISDIENYVEIFNLSYAFVDRIKDMQAVTSSIANCLKARLSDALKGAVSDSSTPSKTEHSNEMPDRDSKENLSQKSDTDVSVAETSEDDDFFSTRKSSRERHRIERYQDDLRTVPVNPRKRIPKDTQNTAWDVAIAEWESLTGETYKKRKGEKIKTILNKIEKLKKGKRPSKRAGSVPPKVPVVTVVPSEKRRDDEIEHLQTQHAKILEELNTLKQKEREKTLTTQNPPQGKINSELDVYKIASDGVDLLKAASKLRHQFHKSDKMKLRDDKKLSEKSNEYEISELEHATEMAVMHTYHRDSVQEYRQNNFLMDRSDFSGHKYERSEMSHQRFRSDDRSTSMQFSQLSTPRSLLGAFRKSENRYEKRQRDMHTAETPHDKRPRNFNSGNPSIDNRGHCYNSEEHYYEKEMRASRREERLPEYKSRDTQFDERRYGIRWHDNDEPSYNRRSHSAEKSDSFYSSHEQRSHSATSHNHRGSSSYHTNHEWSTNHQHREEHLDNRRSRGDSNDNRKVFSRQFERSSQSSSKREYHRNDIYDEGDYESRREYESGEEYEYGDDEYQYGEDVEYY